MADSELTVEVEQQPGATLPPRVSFSQMQLYQQCGLKYFFTYVAGWKELPSAALIGGNIAHDVVERLYRLPNHERTIERARELLREYGPRMLQRPDYAAHAQNNAMKKSVLEAVENLFHIEDPASLMVAPEHLEMQLDVEINGVHFFGRVDRFTTDDVNRVTDYKTGKGPDRFVDDKFRQPYLYALAFKSQYDIDIHEVELIFLNAGKAVRRPVDPAQVVTMGDSLATMRTGSQQDFTARTWGARLQPLCDYCAFQQVCPARNLDAPKPGTAAADAVLAEAGLLQR
jgi:putative RecB family exonuclease